MLSSMPLTMFVSRSAIVLVIVQCIYIIPIRGIKHNIECRNYFLRNQTRNKEMWAWDNKTTKWCNVKGLMLPQLQLLLAKLFPNIFVAL